MVGKTICVDINNRGNTRSEIKEYCYKQKTRNLIRDVRCLFIFSNGFNNINFLFEHVLNSYRV